MSPGSGAEPRSASHEDALERAIETLPWTGWERASNTEADDGFDQLALATFRFQASVIPAYGAYVRSLGIAPERLDDWRAIPPVPASAFKTHDLSAVPPGRETVFFETSGTSISRPGRVRVSSTGLYERSLLRNFERHLLPDGATLPALVFGPPRAEASRSSLWFMVDRLVARFSPSAAWILEGDGPRWEQADETLERASRQGRPVLLLGTTLLFVAYLDRLAAHGVAYALPSGSRAMDTGGAKGTRAEFARPEIEERFARRLGIPATHLVNEYGMAEMGSQFYDDVLIAWMEGRRPSGTKRIPPWVRTRVLDPETLREVPEGERGLLVHYDLANLETPLAVQTEDIGSRRGDRLRLEGRLAGAEARGCSLAFEQFLAAVSGTGADAP